MLKTHHRYDCLSLAITPMRQGATCLHHGHLWLTDSFILEPLSCNFLSHSLQQTLRALLTTTRSEKKKKVKKT